MITSFDLENKLRTAFSPTILKVIDDSGAHAGHAGARPEGGSHFKIILRTPAFEGLSKIQQHQAIYALLKIEMAEDIHALALDTGV